MIPLRDANPTRRTPIVTIGLIAACFAVFLYELEIQSSSGDAGLTRFYLQYGVVPEKVSAAIGKGAFTSPAMVAIVTSMFLHSGWLHLLGNMLYLWIFGNNIEDRLGRLPYLAFYLIGGAVAGLTQVAIDPTSSAPLVGASGAIAATLGAYLVLYPRARILSLVFLGFFYQLFEVPAVIVLGFWFVLQLIDGLTSLGSVGSDTGVAFFAHIGGFAMGMIVAVSLRAIARRPRRPYDRWSVG